jgi:dihydrofolate reductase
MRLILIAAVARNGVIGTKDGISWHYPADLAHFKRTTETNTVIIGRKSYENILRELGEPFPNRSTIVLTSAPESVNTDFDRVYAATSTESALTVAEQLNEDTYIAGGESVYRQFRSIATEAILTRIPESPVGNAVFPDLGAEWECVDVDRGEEITIETHRRIQS